MKAKTRRSGQLGQVIAAIDTALFYLAIIRDGFHAGSLYRLHARMMGGAQMISSANSS
ncbi:hypothetical protein [Hyphomonas sp.]|uniref:hypothetical protein n=1 Tax=Hyphomonas sp. TaxID=87 RepID=UPI003D2C1C0F